MCVERKPNTDNRLARHRLIVVAVVLTAPFATLAATHVQTTAKLEALGARLFTDTRLSADGAVSCATCHQAARAFSDGRVVSKGAFGRLGTRNAPTLLGVALLPTFFW